MSLADLMRRIDAERRANDPEAPQTARELIASTPAGGMSFIDAINRISVGPDGINALQDPAVMQWLQQTQGFNPGVAGQVIAARQGGYDFSDPYMQSIMSFGRAPTQEELSAGWQSVAMQLAGRGDTSLEQAAQAGFFDQFPGFDSAALGNYIAQGQAARDSGGLGEQIARGVAAGAGLTSLSGIEELDPLRNVLPTWFNPDVHERAAYAAAAHGIGQAVNSGLPAYDASVGAEGGMWPSAGGGVAPPAPPGAGFDPATGAGEFNTEYTPVDELLDPHFDYSEFDPNSTLPSRSGVSPVGRGPTGSVPNVSDLAQVAPAAAAPAVADVANSGGSSGTSPSGSSSAANGNALSRILDGTATNADWLSVLGSGAAAGLGAWGANQQADALRDIANQARADRAPFLSRSTDFLNNPNLFFEGPGRSSMDAVLRGLSVHGNPAGMPSSMALAGEMGTRDWLNAVTGLGNLGLSGQDSINRTLTSAAGADANVLNSIGFGVGNILNPPTSLEQLLRQIGKSNQPSLV